jgi:hypothetical protein
MKKARLAILGFMTFALAACSLTITRDSEATPTAWTFALLPSLTPSVTFTVTPSPSPTIPAPTGTPLTGFTPTPTHYPTHVTITVNDTSKGDILTIHRSTDNLEYTIGPIAKGVYAVGPNDDFWVYCTLDGQVYAAKIGDEFLLLIGDVKYFAAIRKDSLPNMEVEIFYNNFAYKANVQEHKFNQNEIIPIPRSIAN